MFGRKKVPAPDAKSSSAALPLQRAGRATAPSIISADLVVNGTLSSAGDVQIEGRVEGDVRSAGPVIGDTAFVHGELVAENLTIRGAVQGNIRARKVLLASGCRVEGNILQTTFAVESGAIFKGNFRHADDPLVDEGGAVKSRLN